MDFTHLKTSIYKLIEWKNKQDKQIYLFVGDNLQKEIKDIIKKLENKKKINSNEKEKLKDIFINYKLLISSFDENNSNIKLIYKNIYDIDTIAVLKHKIAKSTKSSNCL